MKEIKKFHYRQFMAGKCSFHDYYGQFVNEETITRVLAAIDFSKLSSIDALKSVSIREWDEVFCNDLPPELCKRIEDSGGWVHKDFLVHVAKLSAIQVINNHHFRWWNLSLPVMQSKPTIKLYIKKILVENFL